MRLLLDTHVLLWWADKRSWLGAPARKAIEEPANLVVISAASAWEIAIKAAAGKLRVQDDLWPGALADGMVELPISAAHGQLAGRLPTHHRDPFDRMLVAQAMSEGLTVVTADGAFDPYDIAVMAAR